MPRSLIAMYAAAVCFAAAVCMSIAAGATLFSIVRITAPHLTSISYQNQLQVSTPYSPAIRVMPNEYALPPGVAMPPPPPALTEEQLEEARQSSLRSALIYERSAGLRSFLLWGITLLVSTTLWFLHWRILREARPVAV